MTVQPGTVQCAGLYRLIKRLSSMLLIAMILGYMLLLTGLAVASPGLGFTGSIIVFVPESWRDWAHVPAYGVLAWLVMQGFRLRNWPTPYAMCAGILWTMMFGLWTEVAQGEAPGRETSLHDVVKDTAGGLMAATVMLWQQKAALLSSKATVPRTGLDGIRKGM